LAAGLVSGLSVWIKKLQNVSNHHRFVIACENSVKFTSIHILSLSLYGFSKECNLYTIMTNVSP